MGKDGGFMTAKAISKRIKAKGLGRLRWYCQMCEKQCRDENGFKCHTKSSGHQRQLELFSENPSEYITKFSLTFRREFLSILCQRYGTNLINANSVYQEYIKDKEHIHMNATRWTTLTDFIKDLGKEGLCKVEDKDDGFWIAFVDREIAEKDRIARERDTKLLEEEYRSERILQKQLQAVKTAVVARGKRINNADSDDDDNNADDVDDDKKKVPHVGPLSMKITASRGFVRSMKKSSNENVLQSLCTGRNEIKNDTNKSDEMNKKQRSSRWDMATAPTPTPETENIQTSNGQQQQAGGGPWLMKNIIVKVNNSEVGDGAFVGKKGKVIDIIDDYGARISMLDSGTNLELDQDDLETVIPKAGGVVLVLAGKYKGKKGIVKVINVEAFNISVTLLDDDENNQHLHLLEYESVSRLCS